MKPLVSCLMPTFNRHKHQHLIAEAVESFLRQDYQPKELILCNDQPQHSLFLHEDNPQVKIINCATRFPSFASKIDYMVSQAQGDWLCRWDDDDISLPHRISYSLDRILDYAASGIERKEWRSENYVYAPKGGFPVVDYSHGNTHLGAIWHRSLLHELNSGRYPYHWPGGEDQEFNRLLADAGWPRKGTMISDAEIYYIYRWGVGVHWSGPGGNLQDVYDLRGREQVERLDIRIVPNWQHDYTALVPLAIKNTDPAKRLQHA